MNRVIAAAMLVYFGLFVMPAHGESLVAAPQVLAVSKIWDEAPHSAFPDLLRWHDAWWCVFREGDDHARGDGKIRVLYSADGAAWEPVALLEESGVDLRDAKLSNTADDRLMIVAGGSIYRDGKFVTRQPRVAFSADGRTWSPTERVLFDKQWLWRVTWHEGIAYGVTYEADRTKDAWEQILYKSTDGRQWEEITKLAVPGYSGETTLRFLEDGKMMALVRRDNENKNGYVGTATAPYTDWTWKEIGYRLGGPNFVQLPGGAIWAGTRYYPTQSRTVLATLTPDALTPVLLLPSGGDTSYPGMVRYEDKLWFAYYSSHEKRASIYLAQIALPADGQPLAPSYTAQPSEEYMRTWLLCGPFPAGAPAGTAVELNHYTQFDQDWLAACGGEAGIAPKPGETAPLENEQRNWLIYTSEADAINLDQAVAKQDASVAYAYAEIDAPEAKTCVLSLGSNDGVRVWLNGTVVHDFGGARGLTTDTDLVPVILQAGTNRLLLKIEERAGNWGFACRFLPVSASLLKDRLSLFQVVPAKEAAPLLRVLPDSAVLKTLVSRVQLRVSSPANPAATHWEGEWNGAPEMPLPLPALLTGPQVLSATLTLHDGTQVVKEMRFLAAEPARHVLFENTQSAYQIILSAEASESEKWAAEELKKALGEIGGVAVPIVTAPATLPEKALFVGYSPELAALLPGTPAPEKMAESFRYRSVGPHIAIWGGNQRGTMYGVIDFLERQLGCRWYTPDVTVMPTRASFVFDSIDFQDAPLLRVRNDFYHEAFNPLWAAHNRSNGAMGTREQPGGVEGYWGVHTFFPLVPPDEFFATHPEYYSLIDGKRTYERAQLCVTNPDVLNILTERLRKIMREQPNNLIYCVSQNDWHGMCQCENCQAIAREEESEAGPVLWFVNQVADRVKDEFPDKYIGTLAYQYTRKPPKNLRPRDNVVIRLCSIECCFAHDFNSCPENRSFLDDMHGWAANAPHLYVWDYVVNFSHYVMPYPNFRVLASNLKNFAENNSIGVMEQAAYQSRGGEFAELRMYLLSKLLWNYNADVEAIINDFMYGYYGRSGQYVREYFDLLHNQLTPDTHIHLGLDPNNKLFSDAFVEKALQIFQQAEIVADNEDVLHRVEMASLPVLYLKCKRAPLEAKHDGTYAKFSRVAARENVLNYAEAGQPHREAFHAEMDALP